MKHLTKITDVCGLNIVGNIWDNLSTQLNKIYNKDTVVFRYLIWKYYILETVRDFLNLGLFSCLIIVHQAKLITANSGQSVGMTTGYLAVSENHNSL